MPDANVTIHMTTQQLALWQAIDKSNEKFLQMERGLSGVELASRKSARAEADLEKAAKRVWDETRTPMERHMTKLGELNRLVEKGKLDQDIYARAVKQSHDAMVAAGNAGQGGFAKIGGELKGMIGGVLTLGSALGLASRLFSEIEEKHKSLAQKQVESADAMGTLKQIADLPGEGPYSIEFLESKTKEIRAKGGAKSMTEAAEVLQIAKSNEQMESIDFISRLRSTRTVADTRAMVRAATAVQTSFDGAGNLENVVSQAFGAAGSAPGLVQKLLEESAGAAGQAKLLGISPTEMLSQAAILAKATGSESLGTTRLQAVYRAMVRRSGAGPLTAEEAIEDMQEAHEETAKREELARGHPIDMSKMFSGAAAKSVGRRQTEEEHLREVAEKVREQTLTPAERRDRTLAELGRLQSKRMIDDDTFQRATQQTEEWYERVTKPPKPKTPTLDLKGKDAAGMLAEMLRVTSDMDMATKQKFLGRQEALSGLSALGDPKNIAKYRQTHAAAVLAGKRREADIRMGLDKNIPRAQAEQAAAIAEGEAEVAGMVEGQWMKHSDTVLANIDTGLKKAGAGEIERSVTNAAFRFRRRWGSGGAEGMVRAVMGEGTPLIASDANWKQYLTPTTINAIEVQMREASGELKEAATAMKEAAQAHVDAVKGQPTLGSPTQDK